MLRSAQRVISQNQARCLAQGLNDQSIVVLDSCRIPFLKSQTDYK